MRSLRRVLVVQPYGIGDLLFLTPVLRALRLVPTVEKVDLLLGSRNEVAVRHNPHVDEIFSVDKDLFHRQSGFQNFQSVLSLGRALYKNNYDLLLDYSLRAEYAFYGKFFLKITRRAGFGYKRRGFFHNIRLPIPQGFEGRHVVEDYCDLAEAAGIRVEGRFLEFYLSDSDCEKAQKILSEKMGDSFGPFLVVNPSGGESWGKDAHFRRWPAPFFAELTGRLAEKLNLRHLVILGSKSETSLADELARQVSISVSNLSGQLSLGETAALIEKSALFVGNDSGLVHIAHALQVPLIAFYGPVDPHVYGPYPASPEAIAIFKEGLECRPCYHRFRYNSACVGRECLQNLTPDEAWETLEAKEFFPAVCQER